MENNKQTEEKKKLTLKEKWHDKRERAKIELMLYGIFFLVIIVFARISSSLNTTTPKENNIISFINEITDNYQYDITINIDNNNYKYYGKKLGHNMDITRVVNNKEDYFYELNNKYYILDDKGNYILTTTNEVFPYIEYRYLDIDNIKEYINTSTKENNKYNIKISDIILNNTSNDNITIEVDEENKTIVIDYTNLFKIDNNNLQEEKVTIKYSNINNINSLEK